MRGVIDAPAIGSNVTRTGQPSVTPPRDAIAPAVPAASLGALVALKRRLIMPMLVVSLGVFFGVSLLAGVARPFMATKLAGPLNTGYMLIGSIYLVCWGVAVLYYAAATYAIDPLAAAVRDAPHRADATGADR